MNKLKQAARQACQTPLKDLLRSVPKDGRDCYEESSTSHHFIPYGRLIYEALAEIERLEALAEQAEQEPVGEVKILRMNTDDSKFHYVECQHLPEGTKLYAAPVRTKDLTDDEIVSVLEYYDHEWDETTFAIARAVIEKFKEKNR